MFTDTGENSKIKIINIFYVRCVDIFKMKEGRKCFYLTTHSTYFIYGYMALDIW